MSAIAALLIEKIVQYLITKENIDKVIKELLKHLPSVPSVDVTDALQDLREAPYDQIEETLEYVGKVLEAHDYIQPEKYAAILLNNAEFKV